MSPFRIVVWVVVGAFVWSYLTAAWADRETVRHLWRVWRRQEEL